MNKTDFGHHQKSLAVLFMVRNNIIKQMGRLVDKLTKIEDNITEILDKVHDDVYEQLGE